MRRGRALGSTSNSQTDPLYTTIPSSFSSSSQSYDEELGGQRDDNDHHQKYLHDVNDSASTENYYLEYYNTMQKSSFASDQNIARDRSHRINRSKVFTCCAYFSFVGVLFLLFIGILIETQPIYIKGLHKRRARAKLNYINTYQEKSNASVLERKKRRLSLSDLTDMNPIAPLYGSVRRRLGNTRVFEEASNAYKAAFAYFCTMVFCIFYSRYDEQITVRWNRWRRFAPYREISGIGSHYIFKDNQRRGYGTFGKWKRKMGIKWFKEDDKSKKR